MSTWSLVSVLTEDEPSPRVAALAEGRLTSVPPLQGYADLADVLTAWSAVEPLLRSFDPADGVPLVGTVLAPVRSPRKLICAGANYVDHLREMGIPQLPSGLEPYFFLLPPTSIAGPDDVVVIPTDPGARVDWEAELAVVIGMPGRDISEDDALDHVAGYTIMNDISARGYHGRHEPARAPVRLRLAGQQGRRHVLPARPRHHTVLARGRSAGSAGQAVAQRRARAGRQHPRHDLHRPAADRRRQRGHDARTRRRDRHRHPGGRRGGPGQSARRRRRPAGRDRRARCARERRPRRDRRFPYPLPDTGDHP